MCSPPSALQSPVLCSRLWALCSESACTRASITGAQQHELVERVQDEELSVCTRHAAVPHCSLADTRAVNRTPPDRYGARRRYDKKLEPVLRARRRMGRHMPVMNVIPPGLDFSNLKARVPPASEHPRIWGVGTLHADHENRMLGLDLANLRERLLAR